MQATAFTSIRRTVVERRPLFMSIAVLGWSTKYFVSMALTHTTGPEVYGVLTAAIAVAAGIGNLVLIRSSRVRRSPLLALAVTAALIAVWVLVAFAGLGGTIAHVVGSMGHGPVDPRPRPVPAPLIFTVLGTVGALAVVLAHRMRRRAAA